MDMGQQLDVSLRLTVQSVNYFI
ncbi:hypothetical protein NSPZN2_70032 [Nitrospira defluvii]|uniref:Uncharacterized protein n=1 Tax=Nitrospira defluvii TaxID=330214 RepID=A0ABN7MCZ5_9BACT|nr:hypothetical protein NSPZN2_70032 [Nitrospira defluvii]